MSKFAMMSRPKKPKQDGRLRHTLYTGSTIPEVIGAVELFMKEHTHLKLADVSLEYDYDDGYGSGLSLEAAGKPYNQYKKELKQYAKELKVYNDWRADNREEIIKHKAAEKKEIAKRKLERTQDRLNKELVAVQAKLEEA